MAAERPLAHRVVAEELAVAAVAELAVLLVGGGGGAGAALRAAVLVLPEPLIRLAGLRRVAAGAVGELVPFARGVPGEKGKEVRVNPGAQNHPALGVGAPLDPTAQFAGCINPIPCTLHGCSACSLPRHRHPKKGQRSRRAEPAVRGLRLLKDLCPIPRVSLIKFLVATSRLARRLLWVF